MPLMEAQDPTVSREVRALLGLPPSGVRKDLGMKARGCCPSCSGSGFSGEECTSGHCWDCQATGHPHAGPCGFWRWWLNNSLDVLLWLYVWMIGWAIVAGVSEQSWAAVVLLATTLPCWFTWLALDRAYDRRVRARVWNR